MQSWDLARLFDQVERTVSTAGFAMIFVALHSFADATSKGADLPGEQQRGLVGGSWDLRQRLGVHLCNAIGLRRRRGARPHDCSAERNCCRLPCSCFAHADDSGRRRCQRFDRDVLKVSVILSGVVMCWINFFDRAKIETAVAGVGILFALLAAVGATLTRSEINDWGRYSNDMSDAALALEYAMIVLYVSVALKIASMVMAIMRRRGLEKLSSEDLTSNFF